MSRMSTSGVENFSESELPSVHCNHSQYTECWYRRRGCHEGKTEVLKKSQRSQQAVLALSIVIVVDIVEEFECFRKDTQ